MTSFGQERQLLELLVELDLDEASFEAIKRRIEQLGTIDDQQERRRQGREMQSILRQERTRQRQEKQRNALKIAEEIREANRRKAAEHSLQRQRASYYEASHKLRQRQMAREAREQDREDDKRERNEQASRESLDRQRSRAYLQQMREEEQRKRKEKSDQDALDRQRSRALEAESRRNQRAAEKQKQDEDRRALRREDYIRRLRNQSMRDWARQEDQRMRNEDQARRSLDKQRSQALWQSHMARLREEERTRRDMERRLHADRRKAMRGLYGALVAGGAGLVGGFYGGHRILDEQGREATQLIGTSQALGIPLKDLQQVIYVARVMGLYFGPAELADAQNKMIEIQKELQEYEAGTRAPQNLRIGARKLVEYGVSAEDARMENMLPIMEMFAAGWAQGDTEVMAAMNNMFEEQVGKRIGVISTMIGSGEWGKLLSADFLDPEELETISRLYRDMIRIFHEMEVAVQRFFVANKDNISNFIADLRTMVHVLGETLDIFSGLTLALKHLVPILAGLGTMMAVYAVKTWGAAWATAALAAASGQWHKLAAFAAVGIAAGLMTHFALKSMRDSSIVGPPPSTEKGQIDLKKAIEEKNVSIEGQLENILCIARNAEAAAEEITGPGAPVSPLRPPTPQYEYGSAPLPALKDPDAWEFIDGMWRQKDKWRLSDLDIDLSFLDPFAGPRPNEKWTELSPDVQQALKKAGIANEYSYPRRKPEGADWRDLQTWNEIPSGQEMYQRWRTEPRTLTHHNETMNTTTQNTGRQTNFYGDMHINVEEPTQASTAINEFENMFYDTE